MSVRKEASQTPPWTPPRRGYDKDPHRASSVTLGIYANGPLEGPRKFGEQTAMFRDLTMYGRERGVDVMVLTPGVRRTGKGWQYDVRRGRWRELQVSLPDVVIRRAGRFANVPDRVVRADLTWFTESGRMHSLPRSCCNKWLVYRLLQASAPLRSHLPETDLVHSPLDVWRFLDVYEDVYVKPVTGTQGESIHRLYVRDNVPVVAWQPPRRAETEISPGVDPAVTVRELELDTEDALVQFWSHQQIRRRCLVQETIPLPTTEEGRPFDFRWLVQYTNMPHVVARVARVGEPGAITTNMHTGAEAVPAEQMAQYCDAAMGSDLITAADEVALAVAERLRRHFGPFAEVGVDLALRPTGEIVVFEVNPTPGRRMLRALADGTREMSLRYLIEYAIRATGMYVGSDR